MADVEVRQNGAQVAVEPGDRVVVRVQENATTGYQWSARVSGPLEEESSELVPPATAAPGAAGERRVVCRAVGTGTGTIHLTLARPWDAGAAPADRFDVEVSVG